MTIQAFIEEQIELLEESLFPIYVEHGGELPVDLSDPAYERLLLNVINAFPEMSKEGVVAEITKVMGGMFEGSVD